MGAVWVPTLTDEGGGHWEDTTQRDMAATLARYRVSLLGGNRLVADEWNQQGRVAAADWAGLQADPLYARLVAAGARIATPQDLADLADPHGPGNGEGGSDLANIAGVLAFTVGGAYAVNSFNGTSLWGSLTGSPGSSAAVDLAATDLGGGYAGIGAGAGGETVTVAQALTAANGGIDEGALHAILTGPGAVSPGTVAGVASTAASAGGGAASGVSGASGLFGSLLGPAVAAGGALLKASLAPKPADVAPVSVPAAGLFDGGLGGPLLLALGAALVYKMAG